MESEFSKASPLLREARIGDAGRDGNWNDDAKSARATASSDEDADWKSAELGIESIITLTLDSA
jgi:hypothetical protein